MNKDLLINDMTPEAYAAQWGCDPMYDRPPREPGDGALFYNFGSEIQERTPEYLTSFREAISRTIAEVRQNAKQESDSTQYEDDIHNLGELREYVNQLLLEAQE